MSTGTIVYDTYSGFTANQSKVVNFGEKLELPDGATYSRHMPGYGSQTGSNGYFTLSWLDPISYTNTKWGNWFTGGTKNFVDTDGYIKLRIKNTYTTVQNNRHFYLTVEFQYAVRNITLTQPTGGTIAADVSTASYGDTVTLTATPATGYTFSHWTASAGTLADATAATTTLEMPNEDVTISAVLTASTVDLTIGVHPSGAGTVSQSSGQYMIGDIVSITATAATGYRFDRWLCANGSYEDTLAAATEYTVPGANDTLTAVFVPESAAYTVPGRYNGSSYDPVFPFYYDGANWIPCDVKRYNGSSWDDVAIY